MDTKDLRPHCRNRHPLGWTRPCPSSPRPGHVPGRPDQENKECHRHSRTLSKAYDWPACGFGYALWRQGCDPPRSLLPSCPGTSEPSPCGLPWPPFGRYRSPRIPRRFQQPRRRFHPGIGQRCARPGGLPLQSQLTFSSIAAKPARRARKWSPLPKKKSLIFRPESEKYGSDAVPHSPLGTKKKTRWLWMSCTSSFPKS